MAAKRAVYLTYGSEDQCVETLKFIQNAGVLLKVRDISKDPLTVDEISDLVGHLNLNHFLNKLSASYSRHKLDEKLPARAEVIEMMAADHTLIRQPIVCASRLKTVGCDKQKIAEMLQLSANGGNESEREMNLGNSGRGGRRDRTGISGRR
ncbi:MAG: arsenate reductase family protein [Candidatus Zixiibacteriota bacterium]